MLFACALPIKPLCLPDLPFLTHCLFVVGRRLRTGFLSQEKIPWRVLPWLGAELGHVEDRQWDSFALLLSYHNRLRLPELILQMASAAACSWPKPISLIPLLSWSTASQCFTQVGHAIVSTGSLHFSHTVVLSFLRWHRWRRVAGLNLYLLSPVFHGALHRPFGPRYWSNYSRKISQVCA